MQKSLLTLEIDIFAYLNAVFLSFFNPLGSPVHFQALLFNQKGHVNNSALLLPSCVGEPGLSHGR